MSALENVGLLAVAAHLRHREFLVAQNDANNVFGKLGELNKARSELRDAIEALSAEDLGLVRIDAGVTISNDPSTATKP